VARTLRIGAGEGVPTVRPFVGGTYSGAVQWATIGSVVSVNVGARRTVEWHGRMVETGIWKAPVEGRVAVRGVNVDGDEQADLRVHGGVDKAVYAYATEDYDWWATKLGCELEPGTFGENLTVTGFDPGDAVIGAQWRVGTAVFQVTQPRQPCFKLGMRMGDAGFVDEFEVAARFGTYLRIIEEGDVGAGDRVEATGPGREGITVRELGMAARTTDRTFLERILADHAVTEGWQEWARRQMTRQ
jgi:MOSC domain-containing protein YiiM